MLISNIPLAGIGGSPISAILNGFNAMGMSLMVPPMVLLNMNWTPLTCLGLVNVFCCPGGGVNGIGSMMVLIGKPI